MMRSGYKHGFWGRRFTVILMVVLVLSLVVVGCGTAPTQKENSASASNTGSSLTPVTLRTGWNSLLGSDVPIIVALEKGFYKEQGLDLTINMGNGYATTVQLIGNNSDTFGLSDVGSVANGVSHGIPVKMVALEVPKGSNGLIYFKDKPITKPSDVIGKSVAVSQGSGSTYQFETWLTVNNIDKSQIKEISVSGSAKVAAFSQHKVDATVGGMDDELIDANKENPGKIGFISFAESGLNLPGVGIVVNNKLIADKPDLIKKFIAATQKGWEYSKQHPDEAVSISLAKYNEVSKDYLEPALKANLDSLAVQTPGNPWGYMDADTWKKAIDIFQKDNKLTFTGNIDDYFTNQMLK